MKRFIQITALLFLLTLPALSFGYDGTFDFNGSINDRYHFEMTLTKKGNNLFGSYSYLYQDGSLALNGTVDKDGNFVLYETDSKGNRTGVFRGLMYFDMVGEDGIQLNGKWSDPAGQKVYRFAADSMQGC